ncbi:DoxX family membrane protein [Radiobacillus kanasensis]|uniref:DoxX family protein n=1 Tax=Radiobacillus kanasensis TaxID=2844358 RepID=UPI001E5C06B6|nr:DoxX family membrane protein [Radiobacillus kanasensis]UFT99381.1 DoxX family membrane protein [Radiobacillus kanasensis]
MKRTITSSNLIHYLVAYVFIASGVFKLISEDLGGVFVSLGLPYPLNTMFFLAIVEIICGICILLNRYVKIAVIALMVIIIAALILTKIPVLHAGFFHFLFEARLDIVMLGLLFVLFRQYK